MSYARLYASAEPDRSDLYAGSGWQLIEFGAPWCPHCSAAQAAIKDWVEPRDMPHLKIEDGKGRPLGRSFKVTLWPTLILLHEGQEVARVVRPREDRDLALLDAAAAAAAPATATLPSAL